MIAQTHLQLLAQLREAGYPDAARASAAHAYAHAARAAQGLHRGSGKPFVCHLVGTASIVVRCGARIDLVLAALLHALPQMRVGGGRYDATELRRCFGEEVLDLVEHYDRVAASVAGEVAQPNATDDVDIELLLLADELEDLLDCGASAHGDARTHAEARGGAEWRLARAERLLDARVARAYALGQSWLALAFVDWTRANLDAGLHANERYGSLTSGVLPGLGCIGLADPAS